jgi:hypothetical protein
MWDIILIVAASIFSVIWLLLPAEDEIRAFFDEDR